MRTEVLRCAAGCALGTLLMPGCTRIDQTAELQQAREAIESATGVLPGWSADMPVREYRPAAGEVFTLDAAIELALANNRGLRAQVETIGQAKSDLVQAGLLSNPIFSIAFRFPEGGGRSNIDFGLVQDFADLWLIPSRKRAAFAALQQRILGLANEATALVNDVRTAYHRLQYQATAVHLQEQNRRILQEALALAEARFRAGDTSQLDVNLTRGRLLEADLELLQVRAELDQTRHGLLRLMGAADAGRDFQPVALTDRVEPPIAPETALVEAALGRRLDVQAANWEVEAATAEYQQERLKLFPSLSIGVAAERAESRGPAGPKPFHELARESVPNRELTFHELETPGERRRERAREIDFIIGPSLELPVPIFDQNQAQIAKAWYRARELRERQAELEQRVIESVRLAVVARRLAADRVRFFLDALLPQQQLNLEFAQKAYQAGQENILTVLLAQEALIRTRLNFAAAQRDLAISAANLDREVAGHLQQAASPTQPVTP